MDELLSRAIAKDEILRFVLTFKSRIDTYTIRDKMLKGNNLEFINGLIDEIYDQVNPPLDVIKGRYKRSIQANTRTKTFLEFQSYEKQYRSYLGNLKNKEYRENLEHQKSVKELKLVDLTLQDYPKTKRQAKISLIISIVSVLAALGSLIYSFSIRN